MLGLCLHIEVVDAISVRNLRESEQLAGST